jgi:phenylalanyl-tRNA synthetase alpha chain
MDTQGLIKALHPLEVKVLRAYREGDELSAPRLERELHYKGGQSNQAFSWLAQKSLAKETRRVKRALFELTELGREHAEKGTPEERVIALVKDRGPKTMRELCAELGLENSDLGSAFGQLSKEGVLAMDAEKRVTLASTDEVQAARLVITRTLLERARNAEGGILFEDELAANEREVMAGIAKKRGAQGSPFRAADREEVFYAITAEGAEAAKALIEAGVSGDEIGNLSPEILARGAWKQASFRPYNIGVMPARLIPGRTNPYCDFVAGVKDKLVGLGFEEFDGSLVETEFWNSDALFMPQFHAARDIHDAYYVKSPERAKEIEEPWLSRVSAAHRNGGDTGSRGWGYEFDANFTKRLLLRSQGTVLSAHQLPTAKVPGKYFGVARCFRYDQVDATHLSDFYQTEGIVLGEEVNLKTLLGFLEMFAVEVAGATDVKYVPGYFPFTEPSIEVHIKHPVLGWFELGGSGIFRPEVTASLGVKVPVLAWGIGIDRMALMALRLNDLRELFSYDIEQVRQRRAGL